MKYAPLAVGLLFCLSASPVVSLGDVHLLFSRHLRRSAGSSHAPVLTGAALRTKSHAYRICHNLPEMWS